MRRITREKPFKSRKEDILIRKEQIIKMYNEITKDTEAFIVWLEDKTKLNRSKNGNRENTE